MTTRTRVLAYGSVGLLVLVGVLSAVVIGGNGGELVGLVLISLGFVLATSLVFLEVGLSEDRERAREQTTPTKPRKFRPRSRLQRMRGRPRRLR
jgi:hypothetical protein